MTERQKLPEKLAALADPRIYANLGSPLVRWGQIMRTTPSAAALMEEAMRAGRLVPLREIATVKSGVVTRANAFFIVRELPLSEIPNRFHVTRRDLQRVAVVLDGKDVPHRVSRKYLRRIIKGPDALLGPSSIVETDLRLFAVEASQRQLRDLRDNDTLAYLRRGETVNYSVSDDKLKGGIPSERANIKNRRPFWYSLNIPPVAAGRLVVPEHFDQRFIATALARDYQDWIVIDTCYLVECKEPAHQAALAASLNSLFSWYQLELRGRTQHGEGVLKVKIPDFEGLYVLDPSLFSASLERTFAPLSSRDTHVVAHELEQEDRAKFDRDYLKAIGIPAARTEEMRIRLARELREAMAERRTRPDSVADLKTQAKPKQRIMQLIESLAGSVAGRLRPFPDPRTFFEDDMDVDEFDIADFEGGLNLGRGLFDDKTVFAGSAPILTTSLRAQAVLARAVLTLDPALRRLRIPNTHVKDVLQRWGEDVSKWTVDFDAMMRTVSEQVTDPKVLQQIRARVRELVHVSDVEPA